MKGVVILGPGEVEIQEMEKPQLTPGNAILRLLYGGICGSDLGSYKGTFLYAKYPLIPGHEFSAEIVEVGENAYGLKPGMIVTGNPYYNCGHCYSCKRGMVNCCDANETLGCQRDGVFREYFSMPVERIYDGKGISAKELAVVEPFCIGYHAVKRSRISSKDKVLVVGAGTIGHLAALGAKLMGAEVYISDVSQTKLDMAKNIGVAGTILNTGDEHFKNKTDEITGGNGFDVCIEAVGLPSTFMNCIEAAAFRGRVVIVGVSKQSADFFHTIIQKKELDIYGSRNALKEDFLETIDLLHQGKINLKHVVSKEYSFLNADKAFYEMATKGGELLKLALRF
ncbi:zinc-binding alcohol dehydrogenase family protein [Ruminococcaceae bacterium OttesenSCG-928-A16]|nr:zinc-binding alcohol dehydrogenase family protein [Ruminococcaceae bacterium OttesenSCG-928-A16]